MFQGLARQCPSTRYSTVPALTIVVPCPPREVVHVPLSPIEVRLWSPKLTPAQEKKMRKAYPGMPEKMQAMRAGSLRHENQHVEYNQAFLGEVSIAANTVDGRVKKRTYEVPAGDDPASDIEEEIDIAIGLSAVGAMDMLEDLHREFDERELKDPLKLARTRAVCCGTAWPDTHPVCAPAGPALRPGRAPGRAPSLGPGARSPRPRRAR